MNEQELHQVAMCAAQTYADMMVRMAIDQGVAHSSADFGRDVADAYAAARNRLSLTPEERQAEVLRALDVTCAACVVAAAEGHKRRYKANGFVG